MILAGYLMMKVNCGTIIKDRPHKTTPKTTIFLYRKILNKYNVVLWCLKKTLPAMGIIKKNIIYIPLFYDKTLVVL